MLTRFKQWLPTDHAGILRVFLAWTTFYLVTFTLLRIGLLITFGASFEASLFKKILALGAGLKIDIVVALVLAWPGVVLATLIPILFRSHFISRSVLSFVIFVWLFLFSFVTTVEAYFFEEFKSRLNTVAVDYLMFPNEVFVNLWQSYPLKNILIGCALVPAIVLATFRKRFFPTHIPKLKDRMKLALCWTAAAGLGLLLTSYKDSHVSRDRALNDIANNGWATFTYAAITRDLDYSAHYLTMSSEEARKRVSFLVKGPTVPVNLASPTYRKIPGDPTRPKLNVVLFLVESFGSEFWGCLGSSPSWTPELDKLSQEGLLFTNLFASGNRTVRGLEGVLASFPPLPSDSIVKRHLSDHVETLARTLQRDGYSTLFMYGGRGLFDGMRSFNVRNGYDFFLEQKHFENPVFSTIWGVSDEDLVDRAIIEMKKLDQKKAPFLVTLLTVTNHQPFSFPDGRIPESGGAKSRDYAVKFTDYALGRFFKKAKEESFYNHTIFAVVADHGARVYGSASVPMPSYRIPLLILAPAVVKTPQRIDRLGGSLDVSPTLLGLLGRPYETVFFGRSLLDPTVSEPVVPIHHNRDIGLFRGDTLAVLGFQKASEFYKLNRSNFTLEPLLQPGSDAKELLQDAIAYFQVADELYKNLEYKIPEMTEAGINRSATAQKKDPEASSFH